MARPNVLYFDDFEFDDARREQQWNRAAGWFDRLPDEARVVVVEVGAGTTVPTVRRKCETFAHAYGWPLVRINTSEPGWVSASPPPRFAVLDEPCETVLPALDALVGAANAER